MPGKLRTGPLAAVVLTTAAMLVVQSSAASAAPQPIHATPPAGTAAASTITLVTGDKVTLTKRPDGKPGTSLTAGPGREHLTFSIRNVDGHTHVVPSDARPLLDAERLDPRLFDVTLLAEFGYDDAKTTVLPLIVTGGGVGALSVQGAEVTRRLPSIGGMAVAESKQDASAFWRSMTGTVASRGFAVAGVGKVWLNGKSRLFDEQSNAQIGVPAARRAGFDGTGVTVGVLDTGIDATHPDLKDRIGETRDFSGSPDGVKDNVGHGTHVASIIAGTGVQNAANGGVAPRATVMVGKVCPNEFCAEDAIIAGMEWLAGKAKVVNLSLGSRRGTNDDPTSVAANTLTAATGTLFVAAAGNDFAPFTVASPSTADSALSVASVGRTDAVSDFSSKGPRTGDNALKPDIAAPGENIVAARAAGTSMGTPVDDFYVSASGTSMATPHVAGVAALVAQAHPDWTAAKIKATLMGTSTVPAAFKVFDGGTGRVDAARAVSQNVYAEGNLSFPFVAWPHTNAPSVSKTVTYHNEGGAPVTLNLAISDQIGDGAFSINPSALTVTAGGTATATVTLDPSKLPTTGGTLSTRVAATGTGVSVQTSVGILAEAESYNVKITMLDRTGKPVGNTSQEVLLNSFTPGVSGIRAKVVDGVATARLRKGDWHIHAFTDTPGDEATGRKPSTTMEVVSKYTVDRDGQALTLDARKGARTTVNVDRRGAELDALTIFYRISFGDRSGSGLLSTDGTDELYAVPTKTTDGTGLGFGLSAEYVSPANESKPYRYFLTVAAPEDIIPADPVFSVRTADLAQRDVRFRGPGKPVDAEFDRTPNLLGTLFARTSTVSMPSTRTDYLTPDTSWDAKTNNQRPAGEPAGPPFGLVIDISDVEGAGPAGTAKPEEFNKAVIGPSFDLAPHFNADVIRDGSGLLVEVPMLSPADPGQGNLSFFQLFTTTGDTTLTLEGHEPVSSGLPGLGFFSGLPAENSRYTLAADVTRTDRIPWSDLSTKTSAKWTFSSAAGQGFVPLMYFRTTGPFDELNRAHRGPFPLSIDVLRQPRSTSTAKVRNVTVEYSTDDGATWQKGAVLGRGSSRVALVNNPASGFVSLRVTASDSAGDTHSNTVIRAYGVR